MTSEIDRTPPVGSGQPQRLLCDEMLMRLARWLRAAGHDTRLAGNAMNDRDVLRCAIDERRWLITRDRGFLERRHAEQHVILLPSQQLEEQAVALRERLGVDWLYDPFSRCLQCNTRLEPATAVAPELDEVRWCPYCEKLYWEGGHVRRMRAQLVQWRTASFP